MSSYKAIIEIGPIYDYIYATRKSRDLWGASFLFSYLMGETAYFLQKSRVKILRPTLANDYLFNAIKNEHKDFSNVHAGTIPDRIYCELDDVQVLEKAKKNFNDVLFTLLSVSKKRLNDFFRNDFVDKKDQTTEKEQLKRFFRLFYVFSATENFEKLEQAADTRGRIFEFEATKDSINSVANKYERCQLCGDRKAVVVLKNIRSGKYFANEPLCAICTIKRSLYGLIEKDQAFKSTTKVAGTLLENALIDYFSKDKVKEKLQKFLEAQIKDRDLRMNLLDEIGKDKYEKFRDQMLSAQWEIKNYNDFKDFIEFGNLFSEHSAAVDLRESLKENIKIDLKNDGGDSLTKLQDYLIWLKRPFYAIVAMDGDGIGSLLRDLGNRAENNNKKAADLAWDISKALAEFANSVHEVIEEKGGVLFYAGGEDLLFMIHPAYLIDVVLQISKEFQNKIVQANCETIDFVLDKRPLTISAGAYICHHKHPLKLAIQSAHAQLDGVAKKQPAKNTLAIQLYKGGGERANLFLKILDANESDHFTVEKFRQLAEQINSRNLNIPRGFVYKLSEEYDVMSTVITNEKELLDYVKFIFEKTRNKNTRVPDELMQLVSHSSYCQPEKFNYRHLIDRLYFLRFLTGDLA